MTRFFMVLMLLLAGLGQALAAKRHALVIGNDLYPALGASQQLRKAVNDAKAMDAVLRDLGFQVTLVTNAGRDQIDGALDRLEASIESGDVVFVYFSGHGVEIDNLNYLLPSDIRVHDQAGNPLPKRTLLNQSLNAAKLVADLKQKGARTVVAIFDACRDTPFEAGATRSLGGTRGLARMEPPAGVFVMFSAGARQRAVDRLSDADPDPNSVFTRVLVPLIRTPGLSMIDIAKQIQPKVRELAASVGEEQVPAYYDEIIGHLVLVPGAPTPKVDDTIAREAERLRREAAEAVERQRVELERAARAAEARVLADRLKREAEARAEAERLKRLAEARAEAERVEAERREAQRLEAERLETERREAERRRAEERPVARRPARDKEANEIARLKATVVGQRFDFKVCNKTAKKVNIAVSHWLAVNEKWVVEGWWSVRPGECQLLGSFARGQFLAYGEAEDRTFWGKSFNLCASDAHFARYNPGGYTCGDGETIRKFQEFNVDTADYTWNLTP